MNNEQTCWHRDAKTTPRPRTLFCVIFCVWGGEGIEQKRERSQPVEHLKSREALMAGCLKIVLGWAVWAQQHLPKKKTQKKNDKKLNQKKRSKVA